MLTFNKPRWIPGASHGLNQSALVCELSVLAPTQVTGLDESIATFLPELCGDPGYRQQNVLASMDAENIAYRVGQIASGLQRHIGHPVGWATMHKGLKPGAFKLAIPCHDERAGRVTFDIACQVVQAGMAAFLSQLLHLPVASILSREAIDARLLAEKARVLLPYMVAFLHSAERKDIPWQKLEGNVCQLGYGSKARRLNSTFTDRTSSLAARLAHKKTATNSLLAAADIPVAQHGGLAESAEKCIVIAECLGYPVVIKPISQDQGRGVSAGLNTAAAVVKAYEGAKRFGATVIVEKHVDGEDYRLLIVGGKLLAAAHRTPAGVVGDGRQTVQQLIDAANQDPRRGTGRSLLVRLAIDDKVVALLADAGLSLASVPDASHIVRLNSTANVSTGGTAQDVTAHVHPDNRRLAERAARVIGLDIAGVDFMMPDISRSYREVGGAILEVNVQPGFRVHWLADPQRDHEGEVLDWMFANADGRIPIVAIAGADERSAVAGLLHQILTVQGVVAGVSSTQGTWIGDDQISTGRASGYRGGRILLTDPLVDAAIIEMSPHDMADSGVAFDVCDVVALRGEPADDLGVGNVAFVQQGHACIKDLLARARNAIVINADDALCNELAGMRARQVILVAQDPSHARVVTHVAAGQTAVVLEPHANGCAISIIAGRQESITIACDDWRLNDGRVISPNPMDLLFATAIAHAMGYDVETILRGFTNGLCMFGEELNA